MQYGGAHGVIIHDKVILDKGLETVGRLNFLDTRGLLVEVSLGDLTLRIRFSNLESTRAVNEVGGIND